jgi:hypothetical protein
VRVACQFFEGAGLSTCVVEAGLSKRRTLAMVGAFCVTTSIGIIIGIGLSHAYQVSPCHGNQPRLEPSVRGTPSGVTHYRLSLLHRGSPCIIASAWADFVYLSTSTG